MARPSATAKKKTTAAAAAAAQHKRRVVVEELHAPARRRYPRRATVVKGYDDLWQADLVEMQPYARVNRGYRYILVVIDAFSKFVWAVPLKDKSGKEVARAFRREVLDASNRRPKNLHTDRGKEFYNADFQKLVREFQMNHYSTGSNMKASMAERVNRTLKNAMWKEFSDQGSYVWAPNGLLARLVEEYNGRRHRTTGMKPVDVTRATDLSAVYRRLKRTEKKPRFAVGDKVRISKQRSVFAKSYTPNWSTEIFEVQRVRRDTNPTTYVLRDERGQTVEGAFYEQEIARARYPDFFLVEKVLRRRGNKAYVKWLGFDSSANSWVDAGELF
jgi:transposase InsO family protein